MQPTVVYPLVLSLSLFASMLHGNVHNIDDGAMEREEAE